MGMKFANNAGTTLAAGVAPADLTLTVNKTQGANFPALGAGDYFYLTLQSITTPTTIEVVKVTAVAGTVFTIVRAQDGTTAQSFNISDRAELRLVAAVLNDLPKLDEANTFALAQIMQAALNVIGTLTAQGALTVQGALAAQAALTASQGVTFADGSKITSANQHPYGGVRGLAGLVNAVTPLTKYDVSALAVSLRDALGEGVTRTATAVITCDLGLAGPAANGRDQAAVFPVNSWVYLYFIWNPTTLTLATLASLTPPATFTGATLPAGYTHWAFATSLRWNAASNIIPAFIQGSRVFYDLAVGGVTRVLTGGQALAMTGINCAAVIPPIALYGSFNFLMSAGDAISITISLFVRRTGFSTHTGELLGSLSIPAGGNVSSCNMTDYPLGTAQSLDYKIDHVPSAGGGLYLDVLGYTIPNGDS